MRPPRTVAQPLRLPPVLRLAALWGRLETCAPVVYRRKLPRHMLRFFSIEPVGLSQHPCFFPLIQTFPRIYAPNVCQQYSSGRSFAHGVGERAGDPLPVQAEGRQGRGRRTSQLWQRGFDRRRRDEDLPLLSGLRSARRAEPAVARSRYGGALHRQPPGGVGAEAGRQHGEDDRSAATVLHADGTGGEAGLAGAEQGVDYRTGGGRWARGARRGGERGAGQPHPPRREPRTLNTPRIGARAAEAGAARRWRRSTSAEIWLLSATAMASIRKAWGRGR